MVRIGLGCLMLLGALVVACSPESAAKPATICTPGAYVFCRCQDREQGTKLCREEGEGFDACLPCDGSGDPGEGSGGSDGLGAGHGTDSRPPPTGTRPPSTGEQPPSSTTSATPPDGGQPQDAGAPTTKVDAGTSSTKRDAGTGSGSTGSAPSTPNAAHCKPLKNIAPRIEMQMIADEPKPAKGGKPFNGTYVQSWVVEFTGADGEAGPTKHYSKETLELTGTTGRYVFEDDDGTKAAGGFRLTPEGTKVSIAYECPAAEPKDLAYDATESTLIIYDPPYARVFTRQQGTK